MSPKDKTSLFVEFFVDEGSELWNSNSEEIYDLALKHLENMGMLRKEDVRNYYVFKKRFVYPIYDLEYPNTLQIIREYLDSINNLIYIGRPGRFQYTNQDHSLEMGILSARSIIDGKKYNYDDIGQEKEYFETGYIKNDKR